MADLPIFEACCHVCYVTVRKVNQNWSNVSLNDAKTGGLLYIIHICKRKKSSILRIFDFI